MSPPAGATDPRAAGAPIARSIPASLAAFSGLSCDALLGFAFSDAQPTGGALGLVDWYVCGTLTRALRGGMFAAEVGERLLLPTFGRLRAAKLFVFGLGPVLHCDAATVQRVVAQAAAVLPKAGCRSAAGLLPSCARNQPEPLHSHARFCAQQVQAAMGHQAAGPAVTAWFGAPI